MYKELLITYILSWNIVMEVILHNLKKQEEENFQKKRPCWLWEN